MKILITGGAGFIGSTIAGAYVEAGHEVVVVDNLYSGKRENLPAAARFHEVDIVSPALAEVLEAERPDLISHHAAQMDVRLSVTSPAFDAEVNIVGTIRLLEAAVKTGVKRVIFASSGGAAYGEQERFPAREQDRTDPVSPYGVSKRSGEHYLFYYHAVHGLPYLAFRYANVYGPRQDPHGEAGVVAIFCEKLLRGEPPRINGDGRQTRDYVFIEDLVRANLAALRSSFVGPMNLGTGRETDVVTLAAKLVALSGQRLTPVHGPAKAGEQRRSVIDPSLARRELGWEPRVDLDEGLRRTYDWFREKKGSGVVSRS
ncbi:MAG: NAD-dependent epimerase/dehydratase family protein [Deltaproteobacteria bacterium]|nr:NAD-dependent epimerase/dehydratase family protein [Deltaproteobacteria bacterium]